MFICILTIALHLLSTNFVSGKCSDFICENIQDLYDQKLDKNWNFVHFQHWYPVGLTRLKENAFEKYDNLEYITFKRMLNEIHENSLQGLVKLHTIVFTENIMHQVPKNLFKNNKKIEKIVIRNCKLHSLEEEVFNDILSLTDLKIENNNLVEIRNNTFPKNLIELSLRGNKISHIEDNVFNNLNQLEILDLSNNYLTTFEFEKHLNNNPKLKNFQISFNYLQHVTKFPVLNKLKYLYLDNNTISTIDDNSFQNCPNLEILNLNSNRLRNIYNAAFSNMKFESMNKLYLSYNSLACIDQRFLKLFPNLKTFWVGANPLICPCYKSMQKYLITNNIKLPYHQNFEWRKYNECIKYY